MSYVVEYHHPDVMRGDSGHRALWACPQERLRIVQRTIAERGTVRIDELADELRVSGMTIRRDLDELEALGVARRARGGANAVGPEPFATGRVGPIGPTRPRRLAPGAFRDCELAHGVVVDGLQGLIEVGTPHVHILCGLAGRGSRSWPLWSRWSVSKVHHVGGIHAGSALAGTAWLCAFTGVVIEVAVIPAGLGSDAGAIGAALIAANGSTPEPVANAG